MKPATFLFPAASLSSKILDEVFQDQALAFEQAGFNTAIFSVEEGCCITGTVPIDSTIIWRGRMMSKHEYESYYNYALSQRLKPFTNVDQYLAAHYLPNWQPRACEEFVENSEKRYFVINGRYYGQEQLFDLRALALLQRIARDIPSPFFCVDIAERTDGHFRVVEIGDGQVSDLVGWTPKRFAEVWKYFINI